MFKIQLDVSEANRVLSKNVDEISDKAQLFFATELHRLADDYVPFDNGILSANSRVVDNGEAIEYDTPYSRYLWYGKLMVDPVTGKGAFFNENYGFWSRPYVKKVLTDRDLEFQGSPVRGSHWVMRCWNDNKNSIIQATEKYING